MTLISTNTSHKFGPDKTHFKSFIQYPPLRKVTEHSKKLFCSDCVVTETTTKILGRQAELTFCYLNSYFCSVNF